MCYRCFKPEMTCVCARLTPVANRTGIIILQHRSERFHALSTARLAARGLGRVKLYVASMSWDGCLHSPVVLPPDTGLLFPAPSARDLAEVPRNEQPAHLVILDGTWSHARRLYRHNPWLHVVPHFSITPDAPSRYRLRRQPKTHFLSTIESIVQALQILEPETRGLGRLIRAFDEMIATQARYDPRRTRRRHGGVALDAGSRPPRPCDS